MARKVRRGIRLPVAPLSRPDVLTAKPQRWARRLESMGQVKYAGTAERRGKVDVFTGRINLDEAALTIPLKWKKPRRVFVNSMSDLFHEDVPDEFIDRVFAVMSLVPRQTFQILTKRPERMAAYITAERDDEISDVLWAWWIDGTLAKFGIKVDSVSQVRWGRGGLDCDWPLPNVWLGTSVEDQQRAEERIPHLLRTPAAVRFLSCEPLLGPINLTVRYSAVGAVHNMDSLRGYGGWEGSRDEHRLHWIIVGGESGHGARPMHPQWARDIRDQCVAARTPFFFKQWGEWQHGSGDGQNHIVLADGRHGELPEDMGFSGANPANWHTLNPTSMSRVGKKAAGRLLDGRTWDEFPTETGAMA